MRSLLAIVQFFLFKQFPSVYFWCYSIYKRISDADRLKWIKANIKEGMVVLNVGANVGFYTRFLSPIVGETGKIYAFEPDPTNFAYLKRYAGEFKNVVLENKAVGAEAGSIKLYQSESLNVDHQTYDSGEARKFIEVPCVALDTYLTDHKVDFMKIDIQGFEYYAMKGAENILKENKKMVVIGEYSPFGLRKANSDPAAYLALLKDNGFSIDIEDRALTPEADNNKNYYTDFIAHKNA